MKLVGTIIVPGVGAFEVLGEGDLSPEALAAATAHLRDGKAVFFGADFRLRPVAGMFGPVTDEERAEMDRRATLRRGFGDIVPLYTSHPADAPAVVEGRADG